jgi:hypothetical protein
MTAMSRGIERGWQRPFEDPIPLPSGRQLVTLKDGADYIMKLSKADQAATEWRTAIGCLIGAAEGRDFLMHARIGILRDQTILCVRSHIDDNLPASVIVDQGRSSCSKRYGPQEATVPLWLASSLGLGRVHGRDWPCKGQRR